MKKLYNWRLAFVILLVCVCSYVVFANPIKKGLDLSGGSHFTLEVNVQDLSEDQKQDVMDKTLAVYRNRIDEIGFAGTSIQQSGENRIIVQVPENDPEHAARIKEILIRQAFLEFKLVDDGPA